MIYTLPSCGLLGPGAPSAEELLNCCELPPTATVSEDGTITLPLARPVRAPIQISTGSEPQPPVQRLVFNRLTGADLMKNSSGTAWRVRLIIARALRISAATYSELSKVLSADDAVAVHQVVIALVQDEPGLPSQAAAQADGSIFLPLLYPVSDGVSEVHKAFTIRPLSRRDQAAIPGAFDRYLPFALHYSTDIPLRTTRRLAELMDAADFFAADRVIRFLLERPMPPIEGRGNRPGRSPKALLPRLDARAVSRAGA